MLGCFPVLFLWFPAVFSYYSCSTSSTVVQVPHGYRKWPKVTWPRRGFHWKGLRMRNRTLYNIRPSGAFTPEMTSSSVTPKGFPWKGARMRIRKMHNIRSIVIRRASSGSHVIGSALCVFSRTSASYYRFLALSLVICSFPRHFSWGTPSIITQKFVVFGYVVQYSK